MARIDGTSGNDVLNGGADDDELYGYGGNDTLTGNGGADTMYGGTGADRFNISDDSGHDVVFGGDGGDILNDGYVNQAGGDIIDGSALTQDANVTFSGLGEGSITWQGGSATFNGVEWLYTGSGNDLIDGSNIIAPPGTHEYGGGIGIEAGSGDDTIYGSNQRDTIDGGVGNDVVYAGDGSDLIQSSPGDDLVYGGGGDDGMRWGNDWDGPTGHDTYFGGETNEVAGDAMNMWGASDLTVSLTDVESGYAVDQDGNTLEFHEFERILTGAGNDFIDGSNATAGDGSSTLALGLNLSTGAGNDTIYGSAGNDTIDAGHGADWIDGGAGDDVISINSNLYGDPNQPDTQADVIVMRDGGGNDRIAGFAAPVQNQDGSWSSIDKFDLSGLHDADGNPVDVDDVVVDEVNGHAVLRFPNGESITLWGVSAAQVSSPEQLEAIGVPAAPCFVRGTMIACEGGDVAVEDLVVGDLVQTLDHGLRPIRWIGSRLLTTDELRRAEKLLPIRISAGALGNGCPSQDLYVSPQHRVLVRSAIAQRMFGADEVLIAARQLVMLDGIDQVATDQVEYFHLLFDEHEILLSNGAATESLYTGPEALHSIGNAARQEIFSLFPNLLSGELAPSARPIVLGRKARRMAERHVLNAHPLLDRPNLANWP